MMTEKRYYYRDYEELYYIFDSNTISEKEFDEKEEYEGYTAFEDSLGSEEIVDLLNENNELKNEIEKLSYANEDLLEEKRIWKQMSDEYTKLSDENEQLKNENQKLDEKICLLTRDLIKTKSYEQLEKELNRIKNENEELKSENNMLKVTIGRNEAYIKRLTETSEWHC